MSAERELWADWQVNGREDAFEELIRPHLKFAHDLARRYGVSAADADDCVQRALFQLARERNDKPAAVGVRPWLGRCVKLQARMVLRTERRRQKRERLAAKPDLQRGGSDRRDEVEIALQGLQPQEREAIVLRYLHDLDYSEIGFVLGIREGAARVRVHRAIQRVRKRMGITLPVLLALLATSRETTAATATVGTLTVSNTTKAGLTCALLATVSLTVVQLAGWTGSDASETAPRADRSAALASHAAPLEPASRIAPNAVGEANPTLPPGTVDGTRLLEPTGAQAVQARPLAPEESISAGLGMRLPSRRPSATTKLEPDAVTRRYLDELAAEFRRQTNEESRARTLRVFGAAHADYLARTGDASLLPFLSQIIAYSDSESERSEATGSLVHVDRPEVVALMSKLVDSTEVGTRRHAAMGLARSQDPSVWPDIERALGHDDQGVRWNTVMGISMNAKNADREAALLKRLEIEQDRGVAQLIASTLVDRWRVDQERFQAVVEHAPPSTRELLRKRAAGLILSPR